MPIYGAVLITD